MVRVQVQSSSRFKTEVSKAGAAQESDVESRLQANVGLQLDQARVVEEWTDPQSGMLYLWLVTPN
jgi:hypothetical protein